MGLGWPMTLSLPFPQLLLLQALEFELPICEFGRDTSASDTVMADSGRAIIAVTIVTSPIILRYCLTRRH